eukprot:m.25402 g.25402  ORF g.25402 m.25402 type:complete len:626 (+) comp28798_c0_seq7:107-1984(+)
MTGGPESHTRRSEAAASNPKTKEDVLVSASAALPPLKTVKGAVIARKHKRLSSNLAVFAGADGLATSVPSRSLQLKPIQRKAAPRIGREPLPEVSNTDNAKASNVAAEAATATAMATKPSAYATPPTQNGTGGDPKAKPATDFDDDCGGGLCMEQDKLPKPVNAAVVLRHYRDVMSDFERSEVIDFDEIWFLGLEAKKVRAIRGAPNNHGFDDDSGNYTCVMHDHLIYRYEVLEVLGKGSFGQVVKALDLKTNSLVAIKIIRNKRRFHKQALVEVSILQALRMKDRDGRYNIIHMTEFFYHRNHLCIVFNLMTMNLYDLIRKNGFQGFSLSHVRKIGYSVLQCLKLLHRERIIHCDLKPENIMLKHRGKGFIKVIDFGSSCYEYQKVYTYIQSRFYRAPEIILGLPYSVSIDMWSFGCILAELHTGHPLFPGEDEVEQLACIMQICGYPPSHLLEGAQRKKIFFDSRGNVRSVTNTKGIKRPPGSVDLAEALRTSNRLFIDFIRLCLLWVPSQRMTPLEAFEHEWIQEGMRKPEKPVPEVKSPTADSKLGSMPLPPLKKGGGGASNHRWSHTTSEEASGESVKESKGDESSRVVTSDDGGGVNVKGLGASGTSAGGTFLPKIKNH